MTERTREPQYQEGIEIRNKRGLTKLGIGSNNTWQVDPRRFVFKLARYKFVSKILSGKKSAVEIGCGDAFGTRIVLQEVPEILVTDFDPIFIRDVEERMDDEWRFGCKVHDMLAGPLDRKFDAAYSLDVLEHIPEENEQTFLSNILKSLNENGILIVGMPSLESQAYASEGSKAGHVNCKSAPELKRLLSKYFHNVFIFSMNDEVVHTGYHKMAHYLFALGVEIRR